MPAISRSAAADVEELRDRLEAAGPDALDTVDCLAFALRRGAGRQAAGWAERLLAEFGSLAEVMGAPRAALRRVATPAVARDIEVLQALHLRALREPLSVRPRVSGFGDLIVYLRAALATERREQMRVLFLDRRNRLIRVHLAVRALGRDGVRLNPRKADLEAWRQRFAEALRDHGVEAEATPRRARGVTRKSERGPLRRLRQRHEQGRGALGRVAQAKLREAAALTFGGPATAAAWDPRTAERQVRIRRLYFAQARLLQASADPADRRLGGEVEAFVRDMAPPDTERLALARALREANARSRGPGSPPRDDRTRGR